jgi:manganese/iron transport system ATP-binding protein
MNFLRIPRAADRRAVEESLARVGMSDFRERQIGELSGGQKKRVFLARALAQRGRIILLDEPFTGVDVGTETAIIELLRDLRRDGHLMLVSTHNLGSVPEFCDQVVLVNRTVLACGPTSEVFTEQNLTAAFGGVLRHFRFDESTVQRHDGRTVTVLTDDERPLVFGKGGHLEYSHRQGREEIVKQRAEEPDDE